MRPRPRLLYNVVVKQYGVRWLDIGLMLGIPHQHLQSIECDYTDTTNRCMRMLERWLQIDVNATWKKLLDVLDSTHGKYVRYYEKRRYDVINSVCALLCVLNTNHLLIKSIVAFE